MKVTTGVDINLTRHPPLLQSIFFERLNASPRVLCDVKRRGLSSTHTSQIYEIECPFLGFMESVGASWCLSKHGQLRNLLKPTVILCVRGTYQFVHSKF